MSCATCSRFSGEDYYCSEECEDAAIEADFFEALSEENLERE